jgi:hypothetical protein
MKNFVFWGINTQFVLHRRHITCPLQSPASECYVRFGVFTAVTMKNFVFWDINPQFVLHRRQITSPLQSPASECYVKIWGFQGGDYEECRFLGYKNSVRTSQETHYVFATESSQLMLCKFEIFTAVTVKNVVFWDIKTQFVLHRRHIMPPLHSPPG